VVIQNEMPQLSGLTKPYTPTTEGEKPAPAKSSQIKVIAYTDTNSLLIKGSLEQLDLIESLIAQLDVPRRHIELSLWIIDITKTELDQLGITWTASLTIGSRGSATFNGGSSAVNGNRFLAAIMALSQRGAAQVVTRPIILTQDNVPAVFDNNETFYARLEAERVATLESITYGQLVNVLPRYSTDGDEIEMVLDIEDGQQNAAGLGTESEVGGLPVVSRTKISTVARVPKGMSLLIGGFTRDADNRVKTKIPLLGDIPLLGELFRYDNDNGTQRVRVYLIQPKLLERGSTWDAQDFSAPPLKLGPDSTLDETVKSLDAYPWTNSNGQY
jgi:type III secretion protein C